MTEKEKMLKGLVYDPGDEELLTRAHFAKQLLSEYNQTPSTNRDKLTAILTNLLGGCGENIWITAPFFVDYGDNLYIGKGVEINTNCVFLDCNKITIGDNSGLGPGVHIYAAYHPVNPTERLSKNDNGDFAFWKTQSAPVTIGKNVWIGGGAIILPGVSIGDGTTIGAGSVVTKSIPSNCLAVGNPCKVIRSLL